MIYLFFNGDDLQRAQIRGLPGYAPLAIGEWIGENDFVVRFIGHLERLQLVYV